MKEYYPLIISSIAGLGTLLGNILLFIKNKDKNKILALALGLSSAVMFLISVLELIPEGLLLVSREVNYIVLLFYSLALLFIGFIIVNLVDKKINSTDSVYKIGILSMISLLIHNIPEGVVCALTSYSNLDLGLKISFIIMVHNITEGIAICLPIYYATNNKVKAFLFTLFSAVGEIFGALITILLLKPFISSFLLYVILIITAGMMISLSIGKIFVEGIKLKKNLYFMIGIVIGISVVLFTL